MYGKGKKTGMSGHTSHKPGTHAIPTKAHGGKKGAGPKKSSSMVHRKVNKAK